MRMLRIEIASLQKPEAEAALVIGQHDEALLRLGRNIVGPRDGLYVLSGDGAYRVYTQEKGEAGPEVRGGFNAAREAAVDALIQLGGLPYVPAGSRRSGSR